MKNNMLSGAGGAMGFPCFLDVHMILTQNLKIVHIARNYRSTIKNIEILEIELGASGWRGSIRLAEAVLSKLAQHIWTSGKTQICKKSVTKTSENKLYRNYRIFI